MESRWKEVWNKDREFILPEKGKDEFTVYRELKRLDGFDVSIEDAEAYYRKFYDETIAAWDQLQEATAICSAFEAGCGSGANLYLLQNRGIKVGGIDYSASLTGIARQVVEDGGSIRTDEAVKMDINEKYDIVFSDSVPTFRVKRMGWKYWKKCTKKLPGLL